MTPVLVSGLRACIGRYPADKQMAYHADPEAHVSLMLAGSVRERHGGDTTDAEAGWLVTKPVGLEHSDHMGPRGLMTFTLWQADSDPGHEWVQTVKDYRWTRFGPWMRPLIQCCLLAETESETEFAVDELVAAALGSLAAAPVEEPGRPRWLREVQNRLEDSLENPPLLSALAREAGVSPAHLGRELRKLHGCAASEHIHRQRIGRSLAMIERGIPLGEIAMELGYADQAHFTRTFRRQIGAAPGEYRRLTN